VLYRELGDVGGQAAVLWGISAPLITEHHYDEARQSLEDALALYRTVGDAFGIGWSLYMMGMIDATIGRHAEASRHLSDSLREFVGTGDRSAQVLLLAAFAVAARAVGKTERAWKLTGAVDSFRRATGTDLVLTQIPGLLWDLPLEPPADDAGARRAWDDGSRMSFDDAIAYALEAEVKA
jgi:tetratricopeptide (TPR) repeat protein